MPLKLRIRDRLVREEPPPCPKTAADLVREFRQRFRERSNGAERSDAQPARIIFLDARRRLGS